MAWCGSYAATDRPAAALSTTLISRVPRLARAEFVAKKEEAWKKVEEIKQDLGTKGEELTGKKS